MLKELNRYLAWNPGTGLVQTWVERVRVAENGVTVLEDLSDWEAGSRDRAVVSTCSSCGAAPASAPCSC